MPFATHQGHRLYWKLEGEAGRPALVLLNSIGTDMGLYDLIAPPLLREFRLLRMDNRGHGASDAPAGEYSLEDLAGDTLAVMDAAGIDRAAICGVSLGGMIAMQVALDAPQRVSALILACTSPALDGAAWESRIATLRAGGMAAIIDLVIGRFFSPATRAHRPELVETVRAGLMAMNPDGYAGCGAALRDLDLRPFLSDIVAPTLIIAGEHDISMPFAANGQLLDEAFPDARVKLVDTAHLCVLEDPTAVAGAMLGFLRSLAGDQEVEQAAETLFQAGLKPRRQVLGDAWVDRALAARTPFNADYQAMITRYAWNEIWGRPGLDHRTRRLLVLAICAAMARWEEFRLHVRSGLQQGGFTRDELKEVLMQTAIYAGVPAANTAFAEAAEIIRELDGESGDTAHA